MKTDTAESDVIEDVHNVYL